MSEIAKVWFEEAKKLDVGEAIFLRVINKKEQVQLANELEDEREAFLEIDPVHASQICINKVLKDFKQYVVLERKYRAPFVAFHRDKEGLYSKISVDPERRRIIKLMIQDKKTRDEIEETLNGLTETEITEFFP